MTAWLVILGAGIVTYLLRISVVVGLGNRALPDGIARRMRLIGPAVLAALVVSSLMAIGGGTGAGASGADLAAVAAGAAVARRTGNASWALAIGLPIAAIARAIG